MFPVSEIMAAQSHIQKRFIDIGRRLHLLQLLPEEKAVVIPLSIVTSG